MDLGVSEICAGRVDPGIAEFRRAIDEGYRTFVVYAFLAGAAALKGDDAEAKLALAEARRLNPQFTHQMVCGEFTAPVANNCR